MIRLGASNTRRGRFVGRYFFVGFFNVPLVSSQARSARRICSEYGVPSRRFSSSIASSKSSSGRKVITRSEGVMLCDL